MPPALDLSRASHAKMIVSLPRLNLRRAASYNAAEKGHGAPLSSTSSRFNFNHLLFSPPPSPSLPALLPRIRKPASVPKARRVLRRLFRACLWLLGFVALIYVYTSQWDRNMPLMKWKYHYSPDGTELVGRSDVPHFPAPVVVTDRSGRPKWTVSIPTGNAFPLSIGEYAEVCAKCRQVAAFVDRLRQQSQAAPQIHLGFGSADPYYVDVKEARDTGLVPGKGRHEVKPRRALLGEDTARDWPVCQSSMTFILESADAGIGRTLMMLWMAYGRARQEGRAFFVDDSRWAYGEYTSIFGAPPVQNCKPPPRHEIIPCPRQARHLAVSAALAQEVLGEATDDDGGVEGYGEMDLTRQEEWFKLARQGYLGLFALTSQDSEYVDSRVRELRSKTRVGQHGLRDGMVVGMHVRRGDCHPAEFQYRASYIPADKYMGRAREIINATLGTGGPAWTQDATARDHSLVVLASDDPLTYDLEEFRGSLRAQEQIKLASKAVPEQEPPDRRFMHKFVDEPFGWEGGFYAAMFWNLGLPAASTGAQAQAQAPVAPSGEVALLRSYLARAYMMDLAVLARLSDVIVCTASATGCRLLGVMMGWEEAMTGGRWVNIDEQSDWTGVAW